MMAAEAADEEDKVHDKCRAKYYENRCPVCSEPVGKKPNLPDQYKDRVLKPHMDSEDHNHGEITAEDIDRRKRIEAALREHHGEE